MESDECTIDRPLYAPDELGRARHVHAVPRQCTVGVDRSMLILLGAARSVRKLRPVPESLCILSHAVPAGHVASN